MPNANSKKNLQPQKHRVQDTKEYVRGFIGSIGDKGKALNLAKFYEKSADSDNIKNFWTNVIGHINKL